MPASTLRFTDVYATQSHSTGAEVADHSLAAVDDTSAASRSTGNFKPRVVWQAIKAVVTIMVLAIVCATAVSLLVLGPPLLVPGFLVAFMMIMFIGMPLILASITDAVEHDGHEG